MALTCWALFIQTAQAHPVAFEGATAVQFFSDVRMREVQLYHSITSRHSLGTRYIRLGSGEEKRDLALGGANWLLHRWNRDSSQANVYLGGALGNTWNTTRSGMTGLFEIDTDWESRQYYVAAQFRGIEPIGKSRGERSIYSGYARVGFAPYVAEYGDIHTWVILEVDRMTRSGMSTQVTPLLRFFHRNVLFEIGRSFDDNWKFNFMIHL
jgi:hypothetical protein